MSDRTGYAWSDGVVPEDFVIARNPDAASTLPYLIRLPLGDAGVVLKTRETWPRTSKVYCHPADAWPADAEVVERVAVRSCARRGAAIDLVLDRGRENRSQIVFAQARGRQMIFWQTARVSKQARPQVRTPTARAGGRGGPGGTAGLVIEVDGHERYAWKFADQQVEVRKGALAAGDYGIRREGRLVASVERKSLADLTTSLMSGNLRYQLTDLAALPRAAVVVEDRWSSVFKLVHVRPAAVADALAEAQVRWPNVPIVFCETRQLAQEWTYRFLAAALQHAEDDDAAGDLVAGLTPGGELPPREPTHAEVRAWAVDAGMAVSDRGRVPRAVREAYDKAYGGAG